MRGFAQAEKLGSIATQKNCHALHSESPAKMRCLTLAFAPRDKREFFLDGCRQFPAGTTIEKREAGGSRWPLVCLETALIAIPHGRSGRLHMCWFKAVLLILSTLRRLTCRGLRTFDTRNEEFVAAPMLLYECIARRMPHFLLLLYCGCCCVADRSRIRNQPLRCRFLPEVRSVCFRGRIVRRASAAL